MQTIQPRTMSGFLELLPAEQKVFNQMKFTIEQTMKNNGLACIDTPILELSEILLAKAGGETDKQIFRFEKGADMTMRYDLTVPLAKYVSLNKSNLSFPFRRYQIGKVFRGERPQKGRLREFYQCDADIVGDGELPLEADAEVIWILNQIYSNLKIESTIKVSNRKILYGVLEGLNLLEKQNEILNLLDKFEKIGAEACRSELCNIVGEKNADNIFQVFETKNLKELENLNINSQTFKDGLAEVQRVFVLLENMNCSNVEFDIQIIRGLDYYTGTVFEGRLKQFPAISIGGGGRYDNLTTYFSKDKMPGVGFGMGLSRLFVLLKELGKLEIKEETNTAVAIIPIGVDSLECYKISSYLIGQGISAQVLYNKSFKSRMNLANKLKVPYIIVVGEEELQKQIFGLKNMETGETEKLSLNEIKEKLWTI